MSFNQHQQLYEARLDADRHHKELESRLENEASQERTEAARTVRTVRVSNILYTVTAAEIANFFGYYGQTVSVSLTRSCSRSEPRRLHDGWGVVEFATCDVVNRLHQIAGASPSDNAVSDYSIHTIPSGLGKHGHLRFCRFSAPVAPCKPITDESLLFICEKVYLGNMLGSSRMVYDTGILGPLEIFSSASGLAWTFEQPKNRYRFQVAYRHFWGKAGIEQLDGRRAALLLPVRQPPEIFRLPLTSGRPSGREPYQSAQASTDGSAPSQTKWDSQRWVRTTDFTSGGAIGSCMLYRFVLPFTVDELEGEHHGVVEPLWRVGLLHSGHTNAEDVTCAAGSMADLARIRDVRYNVRYYIESLLSTGLVCPAQMGQEFLDVVLDPRLQEELVFQAITLLMTGRHRIDDPARALRRQIKDIMHDTKSMRDLSCPLPEYCMTVARLLVTPTRVVRLVPAVELSNRILRQFSAVADRFIRVSFGDEDGSVLHLASGTNSGEDLVARMRQVLEQGLEVAGRRFEFLAFSTSQLREHSVWAFAPLPELSAEAVRRAMGDFEGIRCVAKYATRMGQCFSSTLDTVELQDSEVVDISDIEGNGYTFSDGCGLITLELADSVAKELYLQGKLPLHAKHTPCAYQLRFGGCKGVVVTYSEHPTHNMSGRRLFVRPSMRKFEARSRRIEIVGLARYLPGFLNRQIISILFRKSLGVPDAAFQELQDSMLKTLDGMLQDSTDALRVLDEYACLESDAQVHSIRAMIEAGFRIGEEPYLRGLLCAIRMHLLKDLKNKTRIFVPDAALLMGVVDETATLRYGEVAIQVDATAQLNAPQIVKGDVIVAKNPCFHPGDVRVLQAVDVPGLRHLRNVVVFPQKGPRPHSNEISGSDLDGDNYFCCWRPALIPPKRSTRPMDFPPAKAKELDRPVEIRDVASFFVDHALTDTLGVIANAHLALADNARDGVFDRGCLQLAALHSMAVDFPKTGVRVEMDRSLRQTRFPDFMEKADRASYPSQTIIGSLYRQVQEPAARPALPSVREPFTSPDPELIVEGHEAYAKDAKRRKSEYEQHLLVIMHQFGVFDEFQLVTGNIVDLDAFRRRSNGKRFDVKSRATEAVDALRRRFLRIFEHGLAEEHGQINREQRAQQKASAWYLAVYSDSSASSAAKLHSFAWVADKYLCQSKRLSRAPKTGKDV